MSAARDRQFSPCRHPAGMPLHLHSARPSPHSHIAPHGTTCSVLPGDISTNSVPIRLHLVTDLFRQQSRPSRPTPPPTHTHCGCFLMMPQPGLPSPAAPSLHTGVHCLFPHLCSGWCPCSECPSLPWLLCGSSSYPPSRLSQSWLSNAHYLCTGSWLGIRKTGAGEGDLEMKRTWPLASRIPQSKG